MTAIQLSFSLRTTSNVKQVHLIGSWDGYQGQLPLSRDSGSTKWKGTFRFQSATMQAGQRYWFYYMLDGYQVSHDPSKEFTKEPTTGRNLNILDVPASASSGSSSRHSRGSSSKSSRRYSRELPQGRPAAEIRSPKPIRPGHLAKQLEAQARTQAALDAMSDRFSRAKLSDYSDEDSDIEDDSDSDVGSDVPSLSSGGSSVSGCSSPSSVSSVSSDCTCERYGITRGGDRVKLDCGGAICGSERSEEDDSSEEEDARQYKTRVSSHHRHSSSKSSSKHSSSSRRHGVVIR
jgi:hypothetical protein